MELFTMLSNVSSNIFSCMQIISILLFLHDGINQLDALKCYTCGETNTFLGSNYTNSNPPLCHDFELSNQEALHKYIIECPPDFLGCITQIQGDITVRTCDAFPIDDCQTANGVTYCYCNYDLCNGQKNIMKNKMQQQQQQYIHDTIDDDDQNMPDDDLDILSDDEDYVEMSGFGQISRHFSEMHDFKKSTNDMIEDDFEEINDTTIISSTSSSIINESTAILIANSTTPLTTTTLKTIITTVMTINTTILTNPLMTEIQNNSLMNLTTIRIDTSTLPTTTITTTATVASTKISKKTKQNDNFSMGIKFYPCFKYIYILVVLVIKLCI